MEGHTNLVDVVNDAPSREWANEYFDMIAEVIAATGATKDDEHIVMSIRPDQSALPVSISHRYCLKGYLSDARIGAILPPGSDAISELKSRATSTGRFSGSDGPDPYYYTLPAPSSNDFFLHEYEDDWLQAVTDAYDRGYQRKEGDAHEPTVYRAAVDPDHRSRILDKAFPAD